MARSNNTMTSLWSGLGTESSQFVYRRYAQSAYPAFFCEGRGERDSGRRGDRTNELGLFRLSEFERLLGVAVELVGGRELGIVVLVVEFGDERGVLGEGRLEFWVAKESKHTGTALREPCSPIWGTLRRAR